MLTGLCSPPHPTMDQRLGPGLHLSLLIDMGYSLYSCSCSLPQCVRAVLSDVEGSRSWPPARGMQACSRAPHACCRWGHVCWLACLPWPWGAESLGGTAPLMQSSAHSLSTTEAGPAPICLPPVAVAAGLSGTREAVNYLWPLSRVAVALGRGYRSKAVPMLLH